MKRFALVALGFCFAIVSLARGEQWSKTYTIVSTPDLRVADLRCQYSGRHLGPEHH